MERWDTLWPGGWTFCFGDGAFNPSTDSFLLGGFPPLRRGWRVCDLGAGTGLLGLLLLAREPALTVTGLELSPAACALAARTAGRLMELENGIYEGWMPEERALLLRLNRDFAEKLSARVRSL